MKKLNAAMIGFLPKEGDPYATLEAYAKIGYRAFEGGDLLLKGDVKENLKKVDAIGMKPLSVHFNIGEPPATSEIIRNALATGVKRVACYAGVAGFYRFGGRPTPPSYDELMQECKKFDEVAKELSKEGIVLSFHNHDAEFLQSLHGVPVIYLMAANTEYLTFEIDCGWVTYAGYDPKAFMKALGSRLSAVHIKDFTEGMVEEKRPDGGAHHMPRFTTPGTGLLDLKGCLETACALNMDYAIVEQDFQYNLTQLETLNAAYLNMKETGFLE